MDRQIGTERSRTGALTRVALAVALASVLSLLSYTLPQGGKISLDAIPILVLSLEDGLVAGVMAGMLFGLVDLAFIERLGLHPLQMFLDYPAAFGALGLAGVFRLAYRHSEARDAVAVGAVILACVVKFLFHVMSGVVWFTAGNYAASFWYNLSYAAPDLLAAVILVPIILRRVRI